MGVSIHRISGKEEFFSFHHAAPDVVHHILAGRLVAYLKGVEWPLTTVALTRELVMAVASQNGLEPDHLDNIDERRLAEPVCMADCDDGIHMVIDGSHRLVKRALLGLTTVEAFLVPRKVWTRFEIDDMPADSAHRWKTALKAAQLVKVPGQ